MSNDSLKNIIGVALGVCLVCSILVATATVALKSRQEANKRLEKLKNILLAGDLMKKGEKTDIEAVFAEKIKSALIELKTGEQLPEEKMTGDLSPEKFDVKVVAKEPDTSRLIPAADDQAHIKRMPVDMMVYFVKEGDGFSKVIMPVYGSGLWSTIYGFLALDKDLKTVRGFTVYEHGETPGLGGEVENPRWQNTWKGKMAFDDQGHLKLKVIKGKASPGSTSEIDGLSGATLTTRGVDNFIHFWLGSKGYGPFLAKLRTKQGSQVQGGTNE
jgi:Na+-transporting NADH:ubiquinone oxidoreductase subunit C